MNNIEIIGNLTKEPETRTTQAGKRVCTFTVAVNRHGREDDKTDYFRVNTWDALAETCQRFLDKGSKVYVRGRITMTSFTGRDGEVHSQLEIDRVDEVEFLTKKQME